VSEDFTTRLQLQLRAAALREERRGGLGRLLTRVRLARRAPAVLAALVGAAALAAVAIAGGLGGSGDGGTGRTAPRLVTTISLADGLGTMAAGFGSVWIADTQAKELMRVDPDVYQVQDRIPFGGTAVVEAGAGAVWVLSLPDNLVATAHLVRIDPATDRKLSRVAITRPGGGRLIAFGLQIVDGVPWVLTNRGALRVDPATGTIADFLPIQLGLGEPFPFFVSVSEDGLWVLNRDERFVRYDLASGRKLHEVPVRVPGAVALRPTPAGTVLVTRDGVVARADPRDGRVAWRQRLGASVNALPFLRGGTLWTHVSGGGRDRLIELDLESGKMLSAASLPEYGLVGYAPVGRQFWLASSNGRLMVLER
jgi:outer membrane protein assembly factor BamB